MPKRVLLTGAAGFIGSHILRYILQNTDWDVVALVTFRHKGKSDRLNIAIDGHDSSRVKVLFHDLQGPISDQTDRDIGPIDYVLSVASDSHVDRSLIEPVEFMQRNVAIVTNLAEWARKHPIAALVHLSTDEVYGPAADGQSHREWADPIKPSNAYSASKAAQEAYLFSCWRAFDLPLILLNLMNQIGQTQDPEKFVPKVLKAALAGEEIQLHAAPDGRVGTRMYMHPVCLASAMVFVLDKFSSGHHTLSWPFSEDPHSTVETLRYSQGGKLPFRFHVAGTEISNDHLAHKVAEIAGKPLLSRVVDAKTSRPGHDLRYALDDSKIRRLGWTPPMDLDDAVRETVEWTMEHPEWLL
jgi:dTDP-glucose 4,6-dehydratase